MLENNILILFGGCRIHCMFIRFLVLSFRSCISLLTFFCLFDFSKVERSMLKSFTMMVDLLLCPCSFNKINFICFKAILLVTMYLELLLWRIELRSSELNYLSPLLHVTLFILSVINIDSSNFL